MCTAHLESIASIPLEGFAVVTYDTSFSVQTAMCFSYKFFCGPSSGSNTFVHLCSFYGHLQIIIMEYEIRYSYIHPSATVIIVRCIIKSLITVFRNTKELLKSLVWGTNNKFCVISAENCIYSTSKALHFLNHGNFEILCLQFIKIHYIF